MIWLGAVGGKGGTGLKGEGCRSGVMARSRAAAAGQGQGRGQGQGEHFLSSHSHFLLLPSQVAYKMIIAAYLKSSIKVSLLCVHICWRLCLRLCLSNCVDPLMHIQQTNNMNKAHLDEVVNIATGPRNPMAESSVTITTINVPVSLDAWVMCKGLRALFYGHPDSFVTLSPAGGQPGDEGQRSQGAVKLFRIVGCFPLHR